MIWYALIAYWLVSVCFFWYCIRAYENDPGEDTLGWSSDHLGFQIALFVLSPLMLPWGIYALVRCTLVQRKYWYTELNTHRDYLARPLQSADVPDELDDFVKQYQAEIDAMGFHYGGDFLVSNEPLKMVERCFMHERLPAYLGLLLIDGEEHRCLMTIFDDGSVQETTVETPHLDLDDYPVACDFHVRFAGKDASTEEYVQTHIDGIMDRCEQLGVRPMMFEAEQLSNLMIYEKRVFSRLKQEQGRITNEVPEPCLPRGVVLQDVSSLALNEVSLS